MDRSTNGTLVSVDDAKAELLRSAAEHDARQSTSGHPFLNATRAFAAGYAAARTLAAQRPSRVRRNNARGLLSSIAGPALILVADQIGKLLIAAASQALKSTQEQDNCAACGDFSVVEES